MAHHKLFRARNFRFSTTGATRKVGVQVAFLWRSGREVVVLRLRTSLVLLAYPSLLGTLGGRSAFVRARRLIALVPLLGARIDDHHLLVLVFLRKRGRVLCQISSLSFSHVLDDRTEGILSFQRGCPHLLN